MGKVISMSDYKKEKNISIDHQSVHFLPAPSKKNNNSVTVYNMEIREGDYIKFDSDINHNWITVYKNGEKLEKMCVTTWGDTLMWMLKNQKIEKEDEVIFRYENIGEEKTLQELLANVK